MTPVIPFLAGAAAGAGLAYLLDPAMGRTRRTQITDKVGATARDARGEVSGALDQATDKLFGAAAEALPDQQPEDAQTLVAKVRSEVLGRQPWRDHTINVDAAGGTVTLRGQLDSEDQIKDLCDAVEGVTGVDEVRSLLHLPGQAPPNVAAPQAASRPTR